MIFRDFSFIADENIDPEIINFLRRQSVKATSLLELDLIGSSDKEILQQALKAKEIILTQDGDFGSLIHTMNLDFYAIVYLRPGHFSGWHHIETLKALLQIEVPLNPPFIIVAENYEGKIKIRIRDKIQG
jgi:predicted nuclease of predicted toxin-antitoxin system